MNPITVLQNVIGVLEENNLIIKKLEDEIQLIKSYSESKD